jgi:hypothetical protein
MELLRLVNDMTRAKITAISTIAVFGLAACGSENAEEQVADEVEVMSVAPDASTKSGDPELAGAVVTPGSPYRVSYRIIGTPVVGSPVTIDLTVEPSRGSQPLNLEYRINDATSMLLAESQPASVRMEPAGADAAFTQQVTIIPQREGRFYLNVSAYFETVDGTMSTVTAIPIQVGTGSRELQPHGEVQLDEDGNAVRVLTNDP